MCKLVADVAQSLFVCGASDDSFCASRLLEARQ